MEPTGRDLRGRVDAFDDVLIDVREFLREEEVLGDEEKRLIADLRDKLEDLFYLIPLKEE